MAELVPNLVENAKSVGIVLTSASAVSYASGYLALRSRAHALGTDPGFTLLDQAYVFAGFRFALIMLIALLVISPLLILVKLATAMVARLITPKRVAILARLAVVALGIFTLAGFRTLFVEGALLDNGSAHQTALQSVLISGVLGSGKTGLFVNLTATATTAITILWLRSRYAQTGAGDPLTIVLVVVAALQLVLLPMQYGIFLADRTARVLDRAPEGVGGVSLPIWLLDRGADRASLLARRPGGSLVLITVKAEQLDGIAVTGTTTIAEIVKGGGAP
jgi:hypothetical protein